MNTENTTAYELVDVPALPSRVSSGGRKSKFSIIDNMPVGKGFYVTEDDVGAARSYIRSRSKVNQTLNIVTRRVTEGEKAGMFLVTRQADLTAPESTPAV